MRSKALLVCLVAACLPGACVTMRPLVKADGTPDGQAIFEQRCGQCHALPKPRDLDDEGWARSVSRYGSRAGVRPEWRPAVIAWLQQANDADDGPRGNPEEGPGPERK